MPERSRVLRLVAFEHESDLTKKIAAAVAALSELTLSLPDDDLTLRLAVVALGGCLARRLEEQQQARRGR